MGCEILAVSAKAGGNRQHPCRQTMDKLSIGHLRTAPAVHQNVEMSAVPYKDKDGCNYTKTVIPEEQKAVYTSYAGKMTLPGKTQPEETARSVLISVDEEGRMDVAVDEREGA